MDNENFLGGFEAFAGSLSNRAVLSEKQDGNFDPEDEKYQEVDPSELETDDDEEDDSKGGEVKDTQKKQKSSKKEEEEEQEEEDGSGEEEDEEDYEDTTKKDDKTNKDDKEATDLGEAEPEISQFVQEKLGEALGWEFGDDEKFESINDVVDFLKEVVDTNSTPEFASDEVSALNEFVQNGGNIEDYIQTAKGEINLDTIDLSQEDNQKAVIKDLLKEQGYSDDRIKRSIERYEDAGVLEDEANDAKETLEEMREKKSKKLLEDQKKQREELQKQQQKYIQDVEKEVNSLESVRGIPISDQEKKQLMDYIFKPTADGRTKYQKDYLSDNKNLIESAYFTMKGDAFVQKVQRKANSDAAKNLKKKLSTKGKNNKKDQDDSGFVWGSISSQLRKPK